MLAFLTLIYFFWAASGQTLTLQQDLAGGEVLAVFPADPGFPSYSQAYNQRFTISPAAVAFPTKNQQVAAAAMAGNAQLIPVVARSGGHSYIANGLGGNNGSLVVDLSNMTAITVVSSNDTAIIEMGNRLGDIAVALNRAGRAIPHGTCPYVGIGGHSGYGGFGFTSRAWGLTLDVIQSAKVVLANGTIAHASPTVNADLFWAIRGASPSFGIVTSIEVKTFAAPPSATAFKYQWDSLNITVAVTAIASFQTFALNIPQELGAELVFSPVTSDSESQVSLQLTGAYYDSASKFHATIAPYLDKLPSPSNTTISPGSYIDSVAFFAGQSLNTTAPDVPDNFYTKSIMTPSASPMSDAAIHAFVTYMAVNGSQSDTDWFVEVELYGGTNSTINGVSPDSTAFAYRDTLFTIQMYASSKNLAPPYPADGFTFLDGMADSIILNSPGWNYGAYLNYADDQIGANASGLYYGSNYPRLQALKTSLDPSNTFRFPLGVNSSVAA
ncbi:glucooligosaccharide oxidase [Mycena vitilis]|nr:glucooligosaccharide oxidase [Mycena vitilis]